MARGHDSSVMSSKPSRDVYGRVGEGGADRRRLGGGGGVRGGESGE